MRVSIVNVSISISIINVSISISSVYVSISISVITTSTSTIICKTLQKQMKNLYPCVCASVSVSVCVRGLLSVSVLANVCVCVRDLCVWRRVAA